MSPTLFSLLVALSTSQPAPLSPTRGAPDGGRVTLPLAHWSALATAAGTAVPKARPPAAITYTDRSIDGVFRKGLLSATLRARFEVHDDRGYLQVPIITDGASPGAVQLNGEPTSLVRRDGMYTVGVDKPGAYEIEVAFFRGQEQDRFARRLQLELPQGGVTSVSLLVPETGIDARLAGGALTGQQEADGGTRVQGYLDTNGRLDLSWTRTLAHDSKTQADVRLETRMDTLVTLGEGLVSGVAVFDIDVREGETDRVDLVLPADVEVMKVTGEAVLQWRTDPNNPESLNVLLRYLVREQTRVVVHFQYATKTGASSIAVKTLLPPKGSPLSGALGVQAPAGLDVAVVEVSDAKAISLRELPSSLTSLTAKPLLFGFRFQAPPKVSLTVASHASVELTTTLIDELQASSVLLEDGTEVTKMRLDIRNNTRQYLQVILPKGAQLTHALLDGHPVRPALAPSHAEALLFTLRQSERIDPEAGRVHQVRPGETLGGLAHRYFGDPGKWHLIMDENYDILRGGTGINVGQNLAIPTDESVTVEESSFVLELAYRTNHGGALTGFGTVDLALPTLDVDAINVVWHLYVPPNMAHLGFATGMTQLDNLRYGILRRLKYFLGDVLAVNAAHAGGYQSILKKRRSIYRDETRQKALAEVAPATFPYVGQRYRFKRVLSDALAPRISFTYLSEGFATGLRVITFGLAALLTLLCLWVDRRARLLRWLIGGLGMAALMVVAHYVLGVHRMLVWGVLTGIVVALWRIRHRRPQSGLRQVLASPWEFSSLATLNNIVVGLGLVFVYDLVLRHPQLLPLGCIVVSTLVWRRWATHARVAVEPSVQQEVEHVVA